MTTFALASELHRLTPAERKQVDHIIADDGEWPKEQVDAYLARWRSIDITHELQPDDWTRKQGELL